MWLKENFRIIIGVPVSLHVVHFSKAFRTLVRTPRRSKIISILPTVKWVYPSSSATNFLAVSCSIRFSRAFDLLVLSGSSPKDTEASTHCLDRKECINSVFDGTTRTFVCPASGSFTEVSSKKAETRLIHQKCHRHLVVSVFRC